MKFGDIAKLVAACSDLAAALGSEVSSDIRALKQVLRDHPEEKTAAFAKRLAKQNREPGVGLSGLTPVLAFCQTIGLAKHEKALAELQTCTAKYGLNSSHEFRSAVEAPVVASTKAPKSSSAALIAEYSGRLAVEGVSYRDATLIIAEIDGDKRVKVNDAREIASRVIGVSLSKGRTRPQYVDEIRTKFIILDREDRKREASQSTSKPWGDV